MRILMIIPQVFYSARGTPLSAYHRIKDLLALGHEVEVLTYKVGDPPPDLPVVVHRSRGPHLFRRIKQGPSYVKIWFDCLLLANLVVRLLRSRYDLLYAHEEGGFIAAWLSPIFRIPLVYDMHSSLPLQIRDWKFSRSEIVVGLFRWVERFTLRRSVAAVAIAPKVADAAREAAPATPVVTIFNRFALEAAASPEDARRLRERLGIESHHKLALYAGSFVALQALDLLVRAIPAVASRVPEVRFVLVGGRPEEIRELEALAREVGADGHLLLLETRPQSEMPVFTAAADVLLSPRVEGINPPGKLFSYLDSGRPIVATDCPVHNQILDPSCAVLTPPDPGGFADGVVAALTDPLLAARLTHAARELLRTRYHPDRRAEAYRELLRLAEAAGRRGPSLSPGKERR